MRFIKESKSILLYNLSMGLLASILFSFSLLIYRNNFLSLILVTICLTLLISAVLNMLVAIIESHKAFKSQNSYKKRHAVEEVTGPPGVGKTTITNVWFYLSVLNMEKALKTDYYVNECHALKEHWQRNSVFIEDLKETRYAKEYFDKSDCYPCAFSNQSMIIKGKSVHKFTHDHSIGKKAVPPYSVEDVEEASDTYYTTSHADRVPEWSTDARFKRHQIKETFLVEQEVTNINKDVRRVVGVTIEVEKRETLLQPKLVINLRKAMLKFGMKHNIKAGWYTDVFDFFGKIISKVGVVMWTYYEMSGTESKIQRPPEKRTFMAFLDLPIEFDSRMYRNVPKTRNLNDHKKPEGYTSLVLAQDSKEAELMRTAKMRKKEGEE